MTRIEIEGRVWTCPEDLPNNTWRGYVELAIREEFDRVSRSSNLRLGNTLIVRSAPVFLSMDDPRAVDGSCVDRRLCFTWTESIATPVMWSLDNAVDFINKWRGDFKGYGYTLALYGSVLTDGHGRDLDLMAIPWRSSPILAEAVGFELERRGWTPVHPKPYCGVMGTWSRVYRNNVGQLLDIVFQPAPNQEQVFERSMRDSRLER